jgi:hypothetical protein
MELILIKNSFISSFKPLLVALSVIALALFGGELLIRLNVFGVEALKQPSKYKPRLFLNADMTQVTEPQINHYLKPNLHIYFQGKKFTTNEYGFRERSFTITPQDSVFRIVSLGDSFTMGWGVGDGDSYSRQLQYLLNRNNENGYEVLNLGVSNYGSLNVIQAYNRFTHQLQPNLILVYIDINTLDQEPLEQPIRKTWSELSLGMQIQKGTNIKLFLEDNFFFYHTAEDIFNRLKIKFVPRWSKRIERMAARRKPPGVTSRSLLGDFITARTSEGIPVVLLSLKKPYLRPSPNIIKNIQNVKTWVEELPGCYFIDANTALTNDITLKDAVYPGNGHPNKGAHKAYAEVIFEELTNIITEFYGQEI